MSDRPTASDPADDEVLFACLAEFSRRGDAGEAVEPEQYRARLGAMYARFLELLAMEGTLRHAVEPGEPAVDLPRATPARYGDFRAVGEGGMGIVFKATDHTLNRKVAFKVVKPLTQRGSDGPHEDPLALVTPEADTPDSHAFASLRKRFLQEAWVTSGLTHPGIIPIYELGETPHGIPYYTMRFVEGDQTLDVAIREARERGLEARLALLEPFLKVCDTIRYAHARGVVHRDLKPQNIALGTFGEVIVLDWGLAKLGSGDDPHGPQWTERVHRYREAADLQTLTSALGTPGYMSPEAAVGDVASVDERSDVYSLGAILFETLTGRLPFRFEQFAELARRLHEETAPRADAVDPEVPTALADLCAEALSRDPSRRPAGVDALAARVRAWQVRQAAEREHARLLGEARAKLAAVDGLAGTALLAQVDRASAPLQQLLQKVPDHAEALALRDALARHRERGIRERGARVRRRLLMQGAALLLLVVAVLALVFTDLLREERDHARALLWQSYRDQARAGRFSGRPGQHVGALAALEHAVSIRRDVGLRDEVLACLPLVDLRLESAFAHEGLSNSILSVDAGFARYARATPEGAIELAELASGRRLHTLPGPGRPVQWTLRFDPTGTRLLAKHADDGPLAIWDVASGARVGATTTRFFYDAFDFHPRGDRVASCNRVGEIAIRSWPDETLLQTIPTRLEPYTLRFSPDGGRIAVTSLKHRWLVVVDVDGGHVKRLLHTTGAPRRLAWSPDGRYIATAVGDGTVHVWRVDGTDPVYRVLRGHQAVVTEVAFTHDGSHLVSTGWDRSLRIWDHEAGALRLTLPTEAGNVHIGPADDRLVLDAQHEVRTYELVLPEGWRRLPLLTRAGAGSVAFGPRGRTLAVAEHFAVQVWDPASRRLRVSLPGRRWSTYFIGARLAASGTEGVFLYDVTEADGELRIEPHAWTPPTDLRGAAQKSAASADGRWMAVAAPSRSEATVFRLDVEAPPRRFAHPGVTRVGLAPDGALLATGAWRGNEIRVFDVETGERVHTIPAVNLGRGQFSPDGRWLLTSDLERLAVHDVATWTQRAERQAPPTLHEAVLSPDGLLIAAADDAGAVLLLRPATLAIVARLASPDGGGPRGIAWSPDGRRLAVARRGRLGTEVWDVAYLRARLAALGLDWD